MGNTRIAAFELVVGGLLLVAFVGGWAYLGGLLWFSPSIGAYQLWEAGFSILVVGMIVGAAFTDAYNRLKKS